MADVVCCFHKIWDGPSLSTFSYQTNGCSIPMKVKWSPSRQRYHVSFFLLEVWAGRCVSFSLLAVLQISRSIKKMCKKELIVPFDTIRFILLRHEASCSSRTHLCPSWVSDAHLVDSIYRDNRPDSICPAGTRRRLHQCSFDRVLRKTSPISIYLFMYHCIINRCGLRFCLNYSRQLRRLGLAVLAGVVKLAGSRWYRQ